MLINIIFKILLMSGIVLPILILTLNKDKKNYLNILLFYFSFLMWCFFNSPLLRLIWNFNIIESKWNWEEKIMALVFSIIFAIIFRKRLGDNNFFTLKQEKKSIAPIFIAIGSMLFLSALFTYFSPDKSPLSYDALAFQLTMPGLDEEFAFRAIMMALLLDALNENIKIGKYKIINPALLITSILFGLMHGFPLTPNLAFKFDYFSFAYSFTFGLIWGWMAIKSRSIFSPILSHNLNNFAVTLITMIK